MAWVALRVCDAAAPADKVPGQGSHRLGSWCLGVLQLSHAQSSEHDLNIEDIKEPSAFEILMATTMEKVRT